jgi:hypothetical protein
VPRLEVQLLFLLLHLKKRRKKMSNSVSNDLQRMVA